MLSAHGKVCDRGEYVSIRSILHFGCREYRLQIETLSHEWELQQLVSTNKLADLASQMYLTVGLFTFFVFV